ncbi:MAG: HslU--HslV peptidase ATPase subunit [Tenericutes bacterium HGW-Tenericutes-4]|jgi:ATP-dependent HslUV protease ATP-binding subunit HslU|nr:MAG: HslU--HslV peptidase ATPase subunit [Tenericutes bacterium HGW-Tenericutes-4]
MNLSPVQIVKELDKYIIGQVDAKRAVAVALRNRYRRSQLNEELREEITPKNIIMKGPTGVGKTEIARRLAKLVKAPFVKVEATKFTEVGYVGRDVESMIRDLVEVAVRLVKEEKLEEVEVKAEDLAMKKLLEIVYPQKKVEPELPEHKAEILAKLKIGSYDNEMVELDIVDMPKPVELMPGMESISIGNIFGGMLPQKKKRKKMTVLQAKKLLISEESAKLIDLDSVNEEAIKRAENEGIVFIDEIDKIAAKGNHNGPDVSREGVQRDILPFVEGCTVNTKYGSIKTDHILFIAAGAFHIAKIENLIPEFQGRFPIRVELKNLTKDDFIKILKEPKNAMTLQYTALLRVDNIDLTFTEDAIEEIAEIAEKENDTSENIGARRLHTIMESILEDISFNANGEHPLMQLIIDRAYVQKVMSSTIKKYDLTKYVL